MSNKTLPEKMDKLLFPPQMTDDETHHTHIWHKHTTTDAGVIQRKHWLYGEKHGRRLLELVLLHTHFCQLTPSHRQKRCFVTKLFQFLPRLNYKMSWDSLMPYVTAWMCTRVFKSAKDWTVSTSLNISIEATLIHNTKHAWPVSALSNRRTKPLPESSFISFF